MATPQGQQSAQDQLNMAVLKRQDPTVKRIIWSASHVCLYRFDEAARIWAKKGIEGTLFLIERNASPPHRLVVLNRVSTENYHQDILQQGFETQVKEPYFIYRVGGEVTGIWFYDAAELQELQRLVGSVTGQGGAAPVPQQPQPGAVPQAGGINGNLDNNAVLSKLFANAMANKSPAGPQGMSAPHTAPLPATAGASPPVTNTHGTDAAGTTILNLLSPQALPPSSASSATAPSSKDGIASKQQLQAKLRDLVNNPQFIDLVWREYQQM